MTLAYHPPKRDVRVTPDLYFHLGENNFLGEARTELINGKIFRMASQYDDHAFCVSMVARWASTAFNDRYYWTRVQMTLHCGAHVPEPDLAVIKGPAKPSKSYMTADRAVLVVEVAGSTLLADTRVKPKIFAGSRVPEYWVVDVENRQLIVHRSPQVGTSSRRKAEYLSVEIFNEDRSIAPLSAPRKPLKVATLFAP